MLEMQGAPEFSDPIIADAEQYAFSRDKVFSMARVIGVLMESTPPELVSIAALNQMQSNLQSPLNELTAFISNKNVGHVANAAAQFEQGVLPYLWAFMPQVQSLSPDSLSTLLEAQASTSRDTIRQLSVQRDDLATKLRELSLKTDTQAARLEEMVSSSVKDRAEAVAAVAKLEQQFAQKETERAGVFEAAVGQFKKDFDEFQSQSSSNGETLLASLEDQKSKAARIVQVVGNIGVTGNYQQIANSEATQANFWRWATVLIFAAGISVAVATFVEFWGVTFTAESAWSVIIRMLYAIAITSPAWYTARESARHRTNSDRARQTELELASIGPFIELLPEEMKNQIRERLTALYFGKGVEAHTVQTPVDAALVKDLAIELAKVFRK
ncbi:MAG: hypothetical protein NVS9B10_11740 [Nevskia sp.]